VPLSPYFAREMLKLARAVVNEHKKRISRQYPPASRKGEYPARRSGNLRRSTVVRPLPLSVATVRVRGTIKVGFLDRAWYGVHLEANMGRLGMAKTIEDVIRTRVKGGRLPKGVVWRRNNATFPG
jgi:hypothetical protein